MSWRFYKTVCILHLTIIHQCDINYYSKDRSIKVNILLRPQCCFQEKKSIAEYWDAGTQWGLRISHKVDQCYIFSIMKYPYWNYFGLSDHKIQD